MNYYSLYLCNHSEIMMEILRYKKFICVAIICFFCVILSFFYPFITYDPSFDSLLDASRDSIVNNHVIGKTDAKIDDDDEVSIFKVNSRFSPVFKMRRNNNFFINLKILQYSAIAIIKNDILKIQSLVVLASSNIQMKCLVADSKSNSMILLPVIESTKIYIPAYHSNFIAYDVKCIYKNHSFDMNSNLLVAIIHEYSYDFFTSTNDMNNQTKVSSYDSILFHKAQMFDENKPKKKLKAHCSQMFEYGNKIKYDEKKLMEFSLAVKNRVQNGYDQIRVYSFGINDTLIEGLTKKYRKYIKFIHLNAKFDTICGFQKHNLDTFGEIKYFYTAFYNCAETFDKTFVPQVDLNLMLKLCAQDCYLNFEYEYQVFTENTI